MAGGTTTIFLNNPSHSKSYVAFIKGIGEAKTKYVSLSIILKTGTRLSKLYSATSLASLPCLYSQFIVATVLQWDGV